MLRITRIRVTLPEEREDDDPSEPDFEWITLTPEDVPRLRCVCDKVFIQHSIYQAQCPACHRIRRYDKVMLVREKTK